MAIFVKLVDKQQGRALKYELAPQLQARHHSVAYLKRSRQTGRTSYLLKHTTSSFCRTNTLSDPKIDPYGSL